VAVWHSSVVSRSWLTLRRGNKVAEAPILGRAWGSPGADRWKQHKLETLYRDAALATNRDIVSANGAGRADVRIALHDFEGGSERQAVCDHIAMSRYQRRKMQGRGILHVGGVRSNTREASRERQRRTRGTRRSRLPRGSRLTTRG